MPTNLAIETRGLHKQFGNLDAVSGLDLQVPRGCVYALVGPRGAGKTTTLRMLATRLLASGGEARVLGHDLERHPEAIRQRVSLTGQLAALDASLSGSEHLIRQGRLHGLSGLGAKVRAHTLLKAFGLQEAAHQPVKLNSNGFLRRLDIATSLVVPPELLLLDEPTDHLDTRSRHQVWSVVRALADEGTTVLLTTRDPEQANQWADRIAIIDQGTITAEGSRRELKPSLGGNALTAALQSATLVANSHRRREWL